MPPEHSLVAHSDAVLQAAPTGKLEPVEQVPAVQAPVTQSVVTLQLPPGALAAQEPSEQRLEMHSASWAHVAPAPPAVQVDKTQVPEAHSPPATQASPKTLVPGVDSPGPEVPPVDPPEVWSYHRSCCPSQSCPPSSNPGTHV